MQRSKKRKRIKGESFRNKVIRNVLSYHSHFTNFVHYMDMDALIAHTHPDFREDLARQNRYF